jgi:hypothetical protein
MPRFHATAQGNIPFTPEEEAERDAEEAAWAAEVPLRLAAEIRDERNRRLTACDWQVMKALETTGVVSPDLAAYRQALRDLPQQPGFPQEIHWPTPPGAAS